MSTPSFSRFPATRDTVVRRITRICGSVFCLSGIRLEGWRLDAQLGLKRLTLSGASGRGFLGANATDRDALDHLQDIPRRIIVLASPGRGRPLWPDCGCLLCASLAAQQLSATSAPVRTCEFRLFWIRAALVFATTRDWRSTVSADHQSWAQRWCMSRSCATTSAEGLQQDGGPLR
jgi:hypothetical protein